MFCSLGDWVGIVFHTASINSLDEYSSDFRLSTWLGYLCYEMMVIIIDGGHYYRWASHARRLRESRKVCISPLPPMNPLVLRGHATHTESQRAACHMHPHEIVSYTWILRYHTALNVKSKFSLEFQKYSEQIRSDSELSETPVPE
jgi:hypothetical protein